MGTCDSYDKNAKFIEIFFPNRSYMSYNIHNERIVSEDLSKKLGIDKARLNIKNLRGEPFKVLFRSHECHLVSLMFVLISIIGICNNLKKIKTSHSNKT